MKLKVCNGSGISIWTLAIYLIASACGPTSVEQNKPVVDKKGEALVRLNKYLVKRDADIIRAYIKRHNWTMKETESGLWFGIYKNGNGTKPMKGFRVTLKYKVELIDGTFCYSSDSSGYKQFYIGSANIEAGLDEGMLYMHQGDAARFILPPHLAHGSMGDNNRIPPRSIILYDVELLKVEEVKRN